MIIALDRVKLRFDFSSPEIESIKRCLETLYSTRAGSQPLDREFGIDWGFIDQPIPVARSEYAFEVLTKTQRYEPRVRVEKVDYEIEEQEGRLIPVITFTGGA